MVQGGGGQRGKHYLRRRVTCPTKWTTVCCVWCVSACFTSIHPKSSTYLGTCTSLAAPRRRFASRGRHPPAARAPHQGMNLPWSRRRVSADVTCLPPTGVSRVRAVPEPNPPKHTPTESFTRYPTLTPSLTPQSQQARGWSPMARVESTLRKANLRPKTRLRSESPSKK